MKSKRKCGRVRQVTLSCNWGVILDVSHTGMKIRCRRRPPRNRAVKIQINGFDLPGPLYGTRVWSRRTGLFSHEVGVQFHDCSPEVARSLAAIAGCGGIRRMEAGCVARFA